MDFGKQGFLLFFGGRGSKEFVMRENLYGDGESDITL